MGKYTDYSKRQTSKQKPKEPPASWRAAGCLMILIVPAISILVGNGTVNYAISKGWVPYQLLGNVVLPSFFYKSNGLIIILGPILRTQNFYAIAAASILYMILIGGVISLIYATIYRMVGPDPYGPTDEPPSKVKITKKSR